MKSATDPAHVGLLWSHFGRSIAEWASPESWLEFTEHLKAMGDPRAGSIRFAVFAEFADRLDCLTSWERVYPIVWEAWHRNLCVGEPIFTDTDGAKIIFRFEDGDTYAPWPQRIAPDPDVPTVCPLRAQSDRN